MSFEHAQEFVAKWEGGYSDHPNDPGGPTNFGICLKFLKEQGTEIGDLDGDGEITVHDIRKMTKAQAAYIMKNAFWDKYISILDYDHPRMAMVCYDTAVNMGPGYAKKLLQEAIGGLIVDGVWGNKTWKAIQHANDLSVAKMMIELRNMRYDYLAERNPKLQVFLKGWKNRTADLMKAIHKRFV